jgi:actinin alpha
MSDDEQPKWVQIQKKTFTKWMNNHLRKADKPLIEDCQNDFTDGIKLMHLINALYDTPMPKKYKKECKIRPHNIDNINQALKMVEDAEIKTNFLKNTHLLDKDLKMILGMVWAIILDFAIKGISVEELTAKQGLLLWVQKKTKGYRDVDPPGVKNFTKNWKNGMAFCALIHRHRPDLIDYDSLDKNNAAENLETAFKIAEEELQIPRLLDIDDMKDIPDERSVMTYVSEFFHCFAGMDDKENAARRCHEFLAKLRAMQELQNDYERRARLFLAFCEEKVGHFENTDGLGDTVFEAKETVANLRNFVVSIKPEQAGELMDLETLFAEIQTELTVNGRQPYVPPEGLDPDSLNTHFEGLAAAQKSYAEAARKNRFRFVQKQEAKVSEEKLEEIAKAFNHFDSNKSNTLDPIEFKAALSALSVSYKDEAEFKEVFNKASEGNDHISLEQFTEFLRGRYEDRDSPEQLMESFKALADGGDSLSEAALGFQPLTEEDAAFLKENMEQNEDGTYNYSKFVQTHFAEE